MKIQLYLPLGVLAALLAAFGIVADEVSEGATLRFDNAVLMALRVPGDPSSPIGPSWLPEAARDVTALGSFSVLTILVVGVVAFLTLIGNRRTALFVTVSVLGGTIVSTVLKMLFDRPRPDLTGVTKVFSASFPSGHATISAVVYLTLGAILAEIAATRRLTFFFFSAAAFLTIIVGLSRIYLGVHFPTDVVAGWSIGAAWALLCLLVFGAMRERRAD
jgi:undecaprenyl-diphosphatase